MRKLLAVIITISLFIMGAFASFAGSYALLREPETQIDSSYLMRFTDDNDSYYLQKAASDIVFYIQSESEEHSSLFQLLDGDGNEMPRRIGQANGVAFKIMPPTGGYEVGKQYTLTLLEDAEFASEELADAGTLVFTIEKEEVERYAYTDAVKTVTNEELIVVGDNAIKLTNAEVSVGDILIHEAASEAYKVVEVRDDGAAIVETPALDEIYAELQVYGEYTWNVEELEWNSDLEVEIANNVRNSSFFDSLMNVAYAKEAETFKEVAGVKVTYEFDVPNNELEMEIEIKLKPGNKGLFGISKLKHQEVTITITSVTGFSLYANIDGPIWNPAFDLAATHRNELSWTVALAPIAGSPIDGEIKKAVGLNPAEYQSIVSDLTKKLANVAKDKESGEIKLFKWTLPLPSIPLLTFETEVMLFVKLELAAEVTLGGHSATRNTAGIIFKDYKFRSYSDEYRTKDPLTLSLTGKGELKAGIKLNVRANVINKKLAYVQITPEAGIYSEVFVTYPAITAQELSDAGSVLGAYGYFEGGLYFGAYFQAAVALGFDKYEYEQELIEKKAPLLTAGNAEIAVGVSSSRPIVRALNNSFTAPEIVFEYYDVTKRRMDSKILPIEDVRFTVDGRELERNKRELKLPDGGAKSFYVNAAYKHTGDGRSYSNVYKVVVSGSEIEGRVSAYTSGSNYDPIPNATVKLYQANDPGTLITSTTSDASGKFSFNVIEGEYALRISATGYKELTSLQKIEKDETKFTEHILLIDNGQSGVGTAGGRINNAIDGRVLEGVELRLRPNWNNREGPYIPDVIIRTDANGQYRIDNVPVGYYTIEAVRDGFYTDYGNIIVHAVDPQYDQNFTISPILPDDQLRIVLRWNEYPRDLDSHLIGHKPDGSGFNVYYSNMHYSWNGSEIANLDVDDTSSYGPETITILQPIGDRWVYAVHDYSNKSSSSSDAMSYSGAFVTVFTGGKQMATFNIPVGEVGTYWTVFEYADGQVRPINAVNNIKPAS